MTEFKQGDWIRDRRTGRLLAQVRDVMPNGRFTAAVHHPDQGPEDWEKIGDKDEPPR